MSLAFRQRTEPVLLWLGLAVAAVLLRAGALTQRAAYDAAAWLCIGKWMGEGVLPYRDVWDNKPPGLYLLARLHVLGGAPRMSILVTEAAFLLLTAVVGARLLRAAGATPRAAAGWALVGMVLAVPALEYPFRPEIPSVALAMSGVALVVLGRGKAALFLAGVVVAGACLLRAQEALVAVYLVPVLLVWRGEGRWGDLTAYVLGGLAVVAVTFAGLAGAGILGAFYEEAVVGGLEYSTDVRGMIGNYLWWLRDHVERTLPAWILAAGGTVLLWCTRRRGEGPPWGGLVVSLFVCYFATAAAGQWKYPHYFYPFGIVAALIGGVGWARLDTSTRTEFRRCMGWPALVLVLVVICVATPRTYLGITRMVLGVHEPEVEEIQRLVRGHVAPEETVLLLSDYRLLGAMLELPNLPGSWYGIGAAQVLHVPREEARRSDEPNALFYAVMAEDVRASLEERKPDFAVRRRGIDDLLTPLLEREFEVAARSPNFTLYSSP